MKNSVIWATNVRTRRTTKKIIGRGRNSETRNPKGEIETASFGPLTLRSLFRISSFSPRDHEHIFEVRKIHGRCHSRLTIQFPNPETLDRPDQQAGRENAADTR